MMRYKLCGGRVIRRKGDKYVLSCEDIYCENGRIVEYDPLTECEAIDMTGNCILPAFFNMHSHLGESLYYDSVSGDGWNLKRYLDYTEGINSQMTKAEKDVFWTRSANMTAESMKKEGTIGFCAARSSGIAKEYGLFTMSGYPIMDSAKLAGFKSGGINKFREFYDENNSDSCSVGVFFHSVYSNDDASFSLAVECMENGAEFITVHVAEDQDSYLLEKQKHGISAVEMLDKHGLLNKKTMLVHCGFCTEDELELISERGSVICVCPISNRFLNTKMPDLYELEKKHIPWCIATDGLATGRDLSLLSQISEARKRYPHITYDKFLDSITRTPGAVFSKPRYSGNCDTGVDSTFLVAEYRSDSFDGLMQGLISGSISCSMKKY